MGIAALLTWLVTAVLGFTMLGTWVARGGLRAVTASAGVTSRFAPGLVFGHFLLAAAGLVIWIVYLVTDTDTDALAWVAFGLLVVVAIFGELLFVRWYKGRGSGTVESGLPKPVVYAHGLFAVTTVVLVLLSALGVGGS
jgi:hypothetical protein